MSVEIACLSNKISSGEIRGQDKTIQDKKTRQEDKTRRQDKTRQDKTMRFIKLFPVQVNFDQKKRYDALLQTYMLS